MTCLQPETETRDNIQHPIESNSNMKNSACTGDSNGALQPRPSIRKTNTALNWRGDYQQAALVLELPPLSAWPLAEWTMGKMDYTEGSAHSGIASHAPECASAERRCAAPLAGIQADPLPSLYTTAYHMPLWHQRYAFPPPLYFYFSIFNTTERHTLGYNTKEDFKPT